MVNAIPSSWTYNETLENLFFFYQCSEELLSYTSPDSFRLPVCNSMTLCFEIRRIYHFLYQGKQIERYYSKYIPCIIDELIASIRNDLVLKRHLGHRLESIITGLTSARTSPSELMRWIDLITQSCALQVHMDSNKQRIIEIVKSTSDKKELINCTQNLYIDLIAFGYSPEYIYQSIIRYFDNRYNYITKPDDILSFMASFNCEKNNFEFYIVTDTFTLENFSRIEPQYGNHLRIKEIDLQEILELKKTNGRINKFHDTYVKLNSNGQDNIKMLSCWAEALDPYSAFEHISQFFDLVQCFEGYFKHKSERKIVFDILQKQIDKFSTIKLRKTIPSRPYIEQEAINRRIDIMLTPDCTSMSVVFSLLKALDMHLDALNCKNAETMLRTFWIALETLFFESSEKCERENAKFCLLNIVQKTYILKQFRFMYEQLREAIPCPEFWEGMQISDFSQFVKVFMSSFADSENFKKFTQQLSNNPLLRSRIFNFRKELCDCKCVSHKIEQHREKVSWHIDRIYRTRNLSTHAGMSMPYIHEILFNIHNYFDYVVNYIICKLENNHNIESISSLVFEAKNDNNLHLAYLSRNEAINSDNYLHVLFGPDQRILNYNFEIIFED